MPINTTNKRNAGNALQKDFPKFRERIEQLRQQEPSLSAFLQKIGTSERTYRKWINGTAHGAITEYAMPSADKLVSIANAYNVSVDYVLGRDDCTSVSDQFIQDRTGLSADSIQMLASLHLLHNSSKISVIDFLLQDNHIQPILPGISGNVPGANDNGLVNLIAAYLTAGDNLHVEGLQNGISIVDSNGNSIALGDSSLVQGALLQQITATLSAYRQEVEQRRKDKNS